MAEFVPLQDVDDFHSIARDFSGLLRDKSNVDISLDFPGTLKRYSGENTLLELEKTAASCSQGEREQFIVLHKGKAVGLSAIQYVEDTPGVIPSTHPNLSGLICHPYRGIGLGKASLVHMLNIVDVRFDRQAYTEVRKENTISRSIVENTGMMAVSSSATSVHYLYAGSSSE